MKVGGKSERGSASVEQAGLAALIALLLLAGIAAVASGGKVDAGRQLADAIGRKIRCAPRLPDACRHHPLVPAYGWPLARLARALAPAPVALPGPSGLPLVPARELRRGRRSAPDCLRPAHDRLRRARRSARLRVRNRLLALPPDDRLGTASPAGGAGGRRSRRRHRGSV